MISLSIFLLFSLMLIFKSELLKGVVQPEQSISIALGFILIFAFLIGKKVNEVKLPQITGFILAGILCGPYVLGFLSSQDVSGLQLLDGLALSLIALTAGGEMHISRLRKNAGSISVIVLSQTLFIILGFVILGLLGLRWMLPTLGTSASHILAFSLLLGTLATATSPATTIAVITETRSYGKYTDLILSSAVVKDFVVIALFALVLSASRSLISPSEGFNASSLLAVLREVGLSVSLGIGIGAGIILYLKYVRRELTIFILGIAFFTYQISHNYDLHPLMICLIAGFIVQNFSKQGEHLIAALEKVSMPVFVIFFAISGASLDLTALQAGWNLALAVVVIRAVLKFFGTSFAARVIREDRNFRRLGWSGYISQAGVALGMAIIVENSIPEWGGIFKAVVLGVIALNQVIGPILLQRFLLKTGEFGRKAAGA